MDLVEGVGESCSPPPSFGGNEIVNDVFNRLIENGNEDAINQPEFRNHLEAHFNRFPDSYALDIRLARVEDVLMHQKLLVLAKDPENRPVFHVRLLENFWTKAEVDDGDQQESIGVLEQLPSRNQNEGLEACSKLEDLNLEVGRNFVNKEGENAEGESSRSSRGST